MRLRSGNRLASFARQQGDINVLENLARGDAEHTVGSLDQIVAFATGVLTAEYVGECEAGGELLGFDQKTGAVSDPWIHCFHEWLASLSFNGEQ